MNDNSNYAKPIIEEEKAEINRSEERHEMENDEIGTIIRQPYKFNSKTWGFIIQRESNTYPDSNDERRTFHISDNFTGIINKLAEIIKEHYKVELQQITGGHEHGKENQKCHLQICVQLTKSVYATLRPGNFELDGIKYLYLAQKAKNPYALINYCKKDGDFYYLFPEKVIKNVMKKDKDGNPTSKVDPYATIVNNKGVIDANQAKEIISNHASRDFFMSNSNIVKAIDQLTKPQLPPPIWTFPEYLKNFKNGILYTWFIQWCFPEDLTRRKALCLFSKERAMGKTTFAKNLINHEDYVVIFRNSFNPAAIQNKIPKLLILDDMQSYTDQNKETWKGLLASEKTSIRDCFCNFQWDYNIPCIVTTNNIALVTNMMLDDQFKTQIIIVEIEDYMGPPDTKKNEFKETEFYVSETIWKAVEEKKRAREEFIKEKKNIFQVKQQNQIQPIQNDQNNNELNELQNELKKTKEYNEFLKKSRDTFQTQYENLEIKLKEKTSIEIELDQIKKERDNLKLQLCTAKAKLGIKRNRDEEEEPAGIDLGSEDSEVEEIEEEPNQEDKDFIVPDDVSIHSEKKEKRRKLKKVKEIEKTE